MLFFSIFFYFWLTRKRAANVLLGKHYNPRLADFGLSVRKQQVLEAARASKPGSDELNLSLDIGGVAPPVQVASPLTPQHHALAPSRFVSSPHLPTPSTDPHPHRPVRNLSRVQQLAPVKAEEAARPRSTVAASHPLGTWPWQAPEVMQVREREREEDVALG